MANTATLASLRAQALDLADLTGSASPVTDRLDEYINTSLSELHDLLATCYEDYMVTVGAVTLVAGIESYALPTDFFKAVRVFVLSGGQRFRLERFSIGDLDRYRDDLAVVSLANGIGLRYRVIGNKIYFAPKPSSGGSVELWYVPQFTTLTGSDVVSVAVPVGWEDYVVCGAAARLLIREESDPSAVLTLKAQARQRIIDCAPERDAGEPNRITDVSGRLDGQRWFPGRRRG